MIKKGDSVDIVSIGTPCTFEENQKIKNYLQKIGLNARFFLESETSITKAQDSEFATIPAKKRFEQLKMAINSDSEIIWCSRGGYGSAEVLPFLQKMKKPKKQKIFIGFSDISSINIFLMQKWNWQTITAPVLIQLALEKVSHSSDQATSNLIFGKTKELKYNLRLLSGKDKELNTEIIGGCISVLSGHFSTTNQIDWKDKILFLEDEGEDGERLDRYFYQIATIINESKIKPAAILLGNFLEANPHGSPKAKNIETAIKRFSQNLGDIPLYQEKTSCLGHSRNMMPLILGKKSLIKNGLLIQKV
jgi:muramoyltetrapeptide carboxypeptidase